MVVTVLDVSYLVSKQEFEAKYSWEVKVACRKHFDGHIICVAGATFRPFDDQHYAARLGDLEDRDADLSRLGLRVHGVLLEYLVEREYDQVFYGENRLLVGSSVCSDDPQVTAEVSLDLITEGDDDFAALYEVKIVVKAPTLEAANAYLNTVNGKTVVFL